MQPERSLPRSQEPVTGPYPRPDESSSISCNPISHRSVLRLSFHLRLVVLMAHFLQIFLPKLCMHFPLMRATCPAHLTSPSLLPLPPSQFKIFPSAPCLRIPTIFVFPLMWDTKLHTHTKLQAKLQFCIFWFVCSWISSRQCEIFIFSAASRPTLGPNQPIQWVPGAISLGVKATRAWSWPLTSTYCRGKLSTGVTLHFVPWITDWKDKIFWTDFIINSKFPP
jgi:hypothetical protein